MKTSTLEVRKAIKHNRKQRRGQAYTVHMYRLHKEANTVVNNVVALPRHLNRELSRRLGSEAARLSIYNKRRVITRREVNSAVRQLRPRGRAGQEGA